MSHGEVTDMEEQENNISNKDEQGRFVKGNKAAKGRRPQYVKEACNIRKILFESFSPEEWANIKKALYDRAMQGDPKALSLMFQYVLGKPVQPVDMSITQATISPEEAKERINRFFGIEEPKKDSNGL